jgi:type II secretory pathway component PulK
MRILQTSSFPHRHALALLVVVYVLAALGTLAFALAFRSRMSLWQTQLSVVRAQQDQMALAACAQACRLLAADDPNVDSYDDAWSPWHALEMPSQVQGGPCGGQVWWRLVDESAKINVNRTSSDVLLRLDGLDQAIVSSILDWIDEDDTPNPDGAEKEYYANLPAGYACRNAPLENLEELALIKGVTDELYFGATPAESPEDWNDLALEQARATEDQQDSGGLREQLTVHGDGRINLNTARRSTLKALPFLSQAAIDEILSRQQPRARKFTSNKDIETDETFSPVDRTVLLQAGKFSSSYFQLQIRVRLAGTSAVGEYAAVLGRDGAAVRVLDWQRKLPHKNSAAAGTAAPGPDKEGMD